MPLKKSGKEKLPAPVQTGIENLTGCSMDTVKLHFNSVKPAQLKALANAQGTDIHIKEEQHLPHEEWHVVQQKEGMVKPTTQLKGTPVSDDQALEKEADQMGKKAAKS